MASEKRMTPQEDDEDSDDTIDYGGRDDSVDQSASRKRRRTSDDPLIHENVSSDQDNDEEASTPPSEYGSEDEEDEATATQRVREKHMEDRGRINLPSDNGILERVELTNFMCHEKMEYDLGPLINFICGKNGSGKSAILTAIVLCLGGKASATNRGGRLQDFIKQGKDSATIVCKIKNRGDGAYMPEEYGQTIQVERHFSRTGTSGFKLKNERGRVISTKKSDLEDICDHFALQIDNPMNVLSQDQARQFISTSSAAEKYKFFVKGVQLEQLDQDYRLIEEQLDNIEAKVEAKRPDIKILEQRMEKAKHKLELSQKHDRIHDKLRDLRRQAAWAQVEAQEAIQAEYAREINEADTKIAEAEVQVVDLDNRFQEADRLNSEASEKHTEADAVVQRAQDEKSEEKAKYDEIKRQTADAQAEIRNVRSSVKEAEATIKAREAEIEQEEQRLAELDGGGAGRRLEDLENAKSAVEDAKQDQENHQNLKQGLQDDIATTLQLYKDADGLVRSKQEEIERQKGNLESTRKSRDVQEAAYHPRMPQLLRAIQQARFEQPPVGPVGRHVRLLKPEWSSILEKSFGSTLNAFIVTNKRDMNLLSDIMAKTNCNGLPILISNTQPLDTTPHEPDQRFDTVLRTLEIDNDLVRKTLVIQHGIDQTVLIGDLEDASRTLFQGSSPVRNVKRCYCFHPSSRRRGFVLSYRQSRPAQDPIDEFVGNPRMKTDIEIQIRLQEDALNDSKSQLRDLEAEKRASRDRHEKAKQAIERHKRQDNVLLLQRQKAEDEVERLKDLIAEDNVEGGKLEVLREALKEAQDQHALHGESFIDAQVELDKQKAALREANEHLRNIDARIAELQHDAQEASVQAQDASKRRYHELHEKNAAVQRIDDAKADRESLQRKKTDLDENIAEWIQQARTVCERVNVDEGETFDSLQKKYKKLNADYQRFQAEIGGTREQIAADAAKTSEAYQNGLRDLRQLEKLSIKLKGSLIERRERWKKFRSLISVRAKAQFTYLLSERSFRGRLITDHKQKLLELSVEPDITKKDGSGRGARTLSGGEKSFSQICLLLAIWEAMGSPIRCLDEFDVFMDAVNRNLSVNLLIEGARQSMGRQFILISPGTKSDIKRAPDVQALEIAQPERGQTRLVLTSA